MTKLARRSPKGQPTITSPEPSLLDTIERLRSHGVKGPMYEVSAGLITDALVAAREQDFTTFKNREQAWLGENIGPLALALQRSFEAAIIEYGPETANAILMGSMLGSSILRTLVERGDISVEECLKDARRRQLAHMIIRYEGTTIADDATEFIFGSEAASALGEIKSPVAMNFCVVTLTSGIPISTSTAARDYPSDIPD